MRLFIFEQITADHRADTPASLRREGAAMLAAITTDFQRVADVVVLDTLSRADAALIIAPEFDDLLATHSQHALDAGCRLLGCTPSSIRLTGDKLRLAGWLRDHGVPTLATRPWDEIGAPFDPPCVLKPRNGAGSQATFVIPTAAAWCDVLVQAHSEWPAGDFIVQPMQRGQAVSVACLIGPRQCIVTPGATQHLSDDGRFHYRGGTAPLPPRLRDRAVPLALRAVAAVPGLQGYVGVDLILGQSADGSQDVVVEINPRLTTSYIGLRRLTQANLADVWLRLWRGTTVEQLVWDFGRVVTFTPDGQETVTASHQDVERIF